MAESVSTQLQKLGPAEILDELATRLYEPPLNSLRESIRELPDAIRVPILIIAFDTELNVNGILGFLENSTGEFLTETIAACEAIGATRTGSTLRRIEVIMNEHGVTTARLHEDLSRLELFQVTTFLAAHGESTKAMSSEVGREAEDLYLYVANGEPVFALLESYVAQHRDMLIAVLVERGL